MFKEIHHDVAVVHAIPPQSLGATAAGGKVSKIIDTAGFGAVEFALCFGAVVATNATVGVSAKEGDTTGALTTVTAANLIGIAQAGLPQAHVRASGVSMNVATQFAYIGLRRYVQIALAPTVSGAIQASAVALLAEPRNAPTTPVA